MGPREETTAEAGLSRDARRMLRHVEKNPGAMLKDIKEALGVGWWLLYDSLKALEGAGLVKTRRVRKARVVFPASGPVPRNPQVDMLSSAQRRVALLILREPGMDARTLRERSGHSERMVYHHLKHLTEAGFVRSLSPGDYRDLRPTEKLLRFLGVDA